jgi:ribosomal protein S18 acetylase RimI-like enzyme
MSLLTKQLLTADNHSIVRRFHCGDQDWSQRAASWIKCGPDNQDGPFCSARLHNTTTWLYFREEDGVFVGFGSLGDNQWTVKNGEPKIDLTYLPMMAVAREFHGQPREPGVMKYSQQILADLMKEASQRPHRFLGLHVHQDNEHAVNLYLSERFSYLPMPADRYGNKRMVRVIK